MRSNRSVTRLLATVLDNTGLYWELVTGMNLVPKCTLEVDCKNDFRFLWASYVLETVLDVLRFI